MKNYLDAGHESAVQRIQHRFAAWRDALDLREAELLADLEQMCARDRAKMESQVEEFQVCEFERWWLRWRLERSRLGTGKL